MPIKGPLPPLIRISTLEAESIASMFSLYDYNLTGRIPKRLVHKLLSQLGFKRFIHEATSPEMSLKEFLLFVDFHCPDPDPPLNSALYTFINTVAEDSAERGQVITPQVISSFMEDIGRPPINIANATMLLLTMVDYDDCSKIPAVKGDCFDRDLTLFAKKNNTLKDFR